MRDRVVKYRIQLRTICIDIYSILKYFQRDCI